MAVIDGGSFGQCITGTEDLTEWRITPLVETCRSLMRINNVVCAWSGVCNPSDCSDRVGTCVYDRSVFPCETTFEGLYQASEGMVAHVVKERRAVTYRLPVSNYGVELSCLLLPLARSSSHAAGVLAVHARKPLSREEERMVWEANGNVSAILTESERQEVVERLSSACNIARHAERSLYLSAPFPILSLTREGYVVRANWSLVRLLGFRSLERFTTRFGPAQEPLIATPAARRYLSERMEAGRAREWIELPCRTESGSIVGIVGWLDPAVSIVKGRPLSTIFVNDARIGGRSVTRTERYTEILERACELGVWDYHIATGVVTVNDQIVAGLGYPLRGAGSLPLEDVWYRAHPLDRRKLRIAWRSLQLRTSISLQCIVRFRHREGDWVAFHLRGRFYGSDATDGPVRVVGGAHRIAHTEEGSCDV